MLRRVALVRIDVSGDSSELADYCHPDDGGGMFFRNVSSYKATRYNIPENGILKKS
jgi:hypothetical protein